MVACIHVLVYGGLTIMASEGPRDCTVFSAEPSTRAMPAIRTLRADISRQSLCRTCINTTSMFVSMLIYVCVYGYVCRYINTYVSMLICFVFVCARISVQVYTQVNMRLERRGIKTICKHKNHSWKQKQEIWRTDHLRACTYGHTTTE